MTVMRRSKGWAFVAWVPDVELGRRQVWRSGFRTRAEAASAERRFLVDVEDGEQTDSTTPGPTVGEFLVDWLGQSAATRRATTSVQYDRLVHLHMVPHLGDIGLRELDPAAIRGWHAVLLAKVSHWGGGVLSPTTVRAAHRVLRRALQDALRWELIVRNPCDAVIAPRQADVEMQAWDAGQAREFLAAVEGDRLAVMWRLFVVTGMRRAEVAGLRWVDIDLDAGRLSVRSTRVLVYSHVEVVEPKTRRSRRAVLLDAVTVDALRAHRSRQGDERQRAAESWTDSGYVFVKENGEPLDPDRISHLFGLWVRRTGLPKIRLHDLRHTAATLALSAGVHPKVVSERLGKFIDRDHPRHLQPCASIDAGGRGRADECPSRPVRSCRVGSGGSASGDGPSDVRSPPLPTKLTFTVPEVAEVLGISRSTAYESVRRGEIPSLTFGRRVLVTRSHLEQLLGQLPDSFGHVE